MTLQDVLKVVDDLDIIEISLIDSNNVCTLLEDFSYYAIESEFGWRGHDLLKRKAIMNHAIYNIIKDYEVFYLTTNICDYEYAVIRITLKVNEL